MTKDDLITHSSTATRRHRRRRIWAIVGVAAAVSTAASALVPTAWGAQKQDSLQTSLNRLVSRDGFPGATATVTDPDGHVTTYTAGVSKLGSTTAPPADGLVRIGSNTKMFTSVVILQLVQESKVSLDQPVDRYLPGLLRGTGIDGRKITVRQLLQHKSGLPNYTLTFGTDLFAIRNTYLSPRDLIDRALSMPADFAPGSRFEYSNTNYAVAGLLAERVTGRPIGELITDRIIDRLHLKDTTFPAPGDSRIHGPHARGYNNTTTGKLEDITVSDPSWAWAAGEIVASPSDLNRFMKALLGGRLLDPAELTQMKTTVPYDDVWANAGYGLGLARYPLSCGRAIWGHGGDIPGYETRNGVDGSGKAVTIAVTALPQALATGEAKIVRIAHDVETTLDTAFCG